MFRKNAIEVAECIGGQYVFPSDWKAMKKASAITGASAVLFAPAIAFAESGGAFHRIVDVAYSFADYAFILVVIFAGISWFFGDQTRMMKVMIGASGGYLLLRNAENIRDFLKSLTTGAS